MNPKLKEYIISTSITFFTVFFLTLSTSISSLSANDVGRDMIFSIILAAIRSGVRAVVHLVAYPSKENEI